MEKEHNNKINQSDDINNCPVFKCNRCASNKKRVQNPNQRKHDSYKPCGYFRETWYELEDDSSFQHIKLVQGQQICFTCGDIFMSKRNMLNHNLKKKIMKTLFDISSWKNRQGIGETWFTETLIKQRCCYNLTHWIYQLLGVEFISQSNHMQGKAPSNHSIELFPHFHVDLYWNDFFLFFFKGNWKRRVHQNSPSMHFRRVNTDSRGPIRIQEGQYGTACVF